MAIPTCAAQDHVPGHPSSAGPAFEGSIGYDLPPERPTVMQQTAATSGRTLRELAGAEGGTGLAPPDARQAAIEAAMQRTGLGSPVPTASSSGQQQRQQHFSKGDRVLYRQRDGTLQEATVRAAACSCLLAAAMLTLCISVGDPLLCMRAQEHATELYVAVTCAARQAACSPSCSSLPLQVVAVDLSLQPPSYGIELGPEQTYRETEASRLAPLPGTAMEGSAAGEAAVEGLGHRDAATEAKEAAVAALEQ